MHRNLQTSSNSLILSNFNLQWRFVWKGQILNFKYMPKLLKAVCLKEYHKVLNNALIRVLRWAKWKIQTDEIDKFKNLLYLYLTVLKSDQA